MARMVPDKDPQILIRAAARLPSAGLAFRVVIAGSPRRDSTSSGSKMKPGRSWKNSGRCRRPDVAHGGLSMTLLEQMMAGLPVVATDVGDTSTAVEEGVTGYLIPAKDEDALVAALRLVIATPLCGGASGRPPGAARLPSSACGRWPNGRSTHTAAATGLGRMSVYPRSSS
jgi:glycosyltransferase involved in cell wall biosynthesis